MNVYGSAEECVFYKWRSLRLEAGSLVLADGGIVCIDEFDKMRMQDQVAIHEAMEQQTISLSKANISTVLNARCSILAAANPMFGSFDSSKSDDEQLNFQASILSRFDAIFRIVDVRDFTRDVKIATHVMSLHKQSGGSHSKNSASTSAENEHNTAAIEPSFLQKYISYAKKTCSPIMGADAMDVLCNYFTKVRTESNNEFFANSSGSSSALQETNSYRGGKKKNNNASSSTIHLSVRQLESLVRMTEAIAKMYLLKTANAAHAEEAVRLFQVSTAETNRSGSSLANMTQCLSPNELLRVHKVEMAIRQCVTVGFGIQTARLIRSLEAQGHENKLIKLAMYSMSRKGDIELRHQRTIVFRLA